MHRPVFLPFYVLIVITLLLSLLPPATAAQPAPNPCPEGQVKLPDQDVCVDPETGLPVPPEEPVEGEEPVDEEEPVVEVPAGNLASFTLYHLACDNDFQADAVRDAGGVGPTNGCLTFGKPPFSYTVAANGIPITTATLDATERDYARLDVPSPVPAGTLTITIAPVAAYTTEFISCALSIGDGFGEIVEPPIANGSATLTTEPDQDIECWVYNVTRETGEQDAGVGNDLGDAQGVVADPPEATGAEITIAAYSCPAGTTAANVLIPTCIQPASGLTFSLLTATETVATQTSNAEGDVSFANVAPNDYGIAETLPAGYGEPIVICYHASANGDVSEGERDIVFGNQFRIRVGAGDSVECAWYNVPAQGPDNGPNIFIQTRRCGEGTAITSSMNVFDAEQICPVVYMGMEFNVLLDEQVIATERASGSSLSPGQLFFTKLPAPDGGGAYGVLAALGEGEQTLAVYCDQDFGDGVFQTVPVTVTGGNRIDQVLYEGHTLRCSWFIEGGPIPIGTQVAGEPSVQELDPTSEEAESPAPGITVLARQCPPEVVELRVVLADVCIVPAVGVTFDVAIGGEPSGTQTTGESGELDIPLGEGPATYLIKSQPKSGHSDPEVACYTTHADGFTEQDLGSAPADSPGYEISFDGASEVICTFYFLIDPNALEIDDPAQGDAEQPEDQAAGGAGEEEGSVDSAPHSLTIQFWACPAGADPAADQAALLQTCGAESQERSFMLTLDGFSTGETVTGTATWEFVEPIIEADIGAGLANSAWCSSTWVEGNEEAADVTDTVSLERGALTVTVSQPATTVSCDWFLFPG